MQDNLDNLLEAVQSLQKFWIEAAHAEGTGLTTRISHETKTYIDMVAAMANLMAGLSEGFTKVTLNASLMPSEAEMQRTVDKTSQLFEMADAIAKEMLEGVGVGEQGLRFSAVNAWANSLSLTMDGLSKGADVMKKVRELQVPNPGEIKQFSDGIREFMLEIGNLAQDMMVEIPVPWTALRLAARVLGWTWPWLGR